MSAFRWPTPIPHPQTHYWLARPFIPPAQTWASPYYPYGSNGGGRYLIHHGADFPNPEGTTILAGDEGVVVFAGKDDNKQLGPWPNFYGQALVLRLERTFEGRPLFLLYGHIRRWLVHQGEHVRRGQPIAEVGQEGIALGPHLHLEVRLGSNSYTATVNPEFWLEFMQGYGTLIGRLVTPEGYAWMGAYIQVYRIKKGKPHYWTSIPTYIYEPGIQPDPHWGENWLLTDVPQGDYILEVSMQGTIIRRRVHVNAQDTVFVEFVVPPKQSTRKP